MCPLKRRFSFLTSQGNGSSAMMMPTMATMDPPALIPHVSDTSTTSTATASSMSSLDTTGDDQEFLPLPPNYRPAKMDIVCGRGRGYYNCAGNVMFRRVVQDHLNLYLEQRSKAAKTEVLKDIVFQIRNDHPHTKFVKQLGCGKWFELSEHLARDKVGNAMREAVSSRNKQKAAAKQQTSSSFSWNPLSKKQQRKRQEAPSHNKSKSSARKCLIDTDDDSDLYWAQQEQIAREARQRQEQEMANNSSSGMPTPPQISSMGLTPIAFTPEAVGSAPVGCGQEDLVFGRQVQLVNTSQEFQLEHPSKRSRSNSNNFGGNYNYANDNNLRRSSLLSMVNMTNIGLLDDVPSSMDAFVPALVGSSSSNSQPAPMDLGLESSSAEFLLECIN